MDNSGERGLLAGVSTTLTLLNVALGPETGIRGLQLPQRTLIDHSVPLFPAFLFCRDPEPFGEAVRRRDFIALAGGTARRKTG